MKRLMILSILAVLALPMMAAASHFEGVDGGADCSGWTATANVRFGNLTFEGTLHVVVVLSNEMGEVLNMVEFTEPIARDEGSSTLQTYTFSGEWEGTHYAQMFMVHQLIELAVTSGDTDQSALELELECTVDSEDTDWGALKATYR